MESIKLRNLLEKNCDKEIALIADTQDGNFKKITYETVFEMANKIKSFVLGHILEDNICIGLLMDKNVLLPSIIISFQDLHYSFMFLTTQTLFDTISRLNIKWIMSVEDITPLSADWVTEFSLKETFKVANNGVIKLWTNNAHHKDKDPLSYKDIFCVVQTSGSTGTCKTVRVPHSCIEKNVLSINNYFGVTKKDVIYWGTPLTFDPTWVEFILGISCQATLVILPKLVKLNPTLLYQALFKMNSTTILQVVPSVFLRWSKLQIAEILLNSTLRILAFGGETFPQEILNSERNPKLKLFNLYGVTELSCWATIADVTLHSIDREVPLGEALDETFIQVKNEDQQQPDVGVICIGSHTRHCLIGNSKSTPSNPFVVETGDLGEVKDGNLLYRGRKIRVIKRFGHRVVLHKIENNIFEETGLQSRLVYSACHKKLLAFILVEDHYNKNVKARMLDKLRVKLLNIIPEHGIPDFLDVLTQFPLNGHGKICDKSLERLYQKSLNASLNNQNHPSEIFIDVLSGYLKTEFRENLDQLGKHTFFELGGNSILVMQFLQTLEDRIGTSIPGELVTLLINNSIQTCLNYVIQNLNFKRRLDNISSDIEPKLLRICREQSPYVLWKYNLKGCVDSAPLAFKIDDKIFIAVGSFAHIFAVVCQNGEKYLEISLPEEVDAQPSISQCGAFIFIGCANGCMYSIDLKLKKIAWKYNTLEKVRSTACVCENSIVFGSYDGFVYCLTVKDGILNWKTELLGGIRADPVHEKRLNRIYIGTTKGMCYGINGENGNAVWTYKMEGPLFGSPCIVRDCAVFSSVMGKIYCLSSTGDIRWTLQLCGNIFSSLIVHEDSIYFGCHDSHIYKIALCNDTQKLLKIIKLDSETSSSPFIYKYKDRIYVIAVCNVGVLYVVDALSKAVVFRMQFPAECFSSPYVFENRVYVGCRDNNLYCINIEHALIAYVA